MTTKGNPYAHVVLRGGSNGPNYDSVHVAQCEKTLEDCGGSSNIVIDCSHANSSKNPNLQPLVIKDITRQILEGNKSIIGLMLESFIKAGNQTIPKNLNDLKYGISVTDACMDWETTEKSIIEMASKIESVLNGRRGKI